MGWKVGSGVNWWLCLDPVPSATLRPACVRLRHLCFSAHLSALCSSRYQLTSPLSTI